MFNSLSFNRIRIFCLLFLTFIFSPIYAENIDISRDQAKSTYFSGKLDLSHSLFLDLSASGDAESQYYLGLIYLTEGWSGRNVEKAISYLTSAADQSNTEAMWKLGEVYENGLGVKKDLLMALDWYRKSKQSEVINSRVSFIKLNNDQLVNKPVSAVIVELENKAKKNDAEAEFKLGNIYDEGKLTEQNLAKAHFWYKKAAINNHSYSKLMLGYFLCRGIGTEINKTKANDWLTKSGRSAQCN